MATIVATAVITVAGMLLADGWELPAGAGAVWVIAVLVIVRYVHSRMLWFRRPMSLRAAHARISSADREIWSFQISGSEFTVNSVKAYDDWLCADVNRRFRVAFANPHNEGLLQSIVKLSGVDKISNEREALRHLREVILTSLGKYVALKEAHPDQVDVRVYDCSPPCSIHAVDPESGSRHRSIYVECYLPGLPSRERPCLLLSRRHAYFERYVEQSLAWFEEARPPRAIESSAPTTPL